MRDACMPTYDVFATSACSSLSAVKRITINTELQILCDAGAELNVLPSHYSRFNVRKEKCLSFRVEVSNLPFWLCPLFCFI